MRRGVRSLSFVFALALGPLACGDDGESHDGHGAMDGFVAEECDAEERAQADVYETNLTKEGAMGRYQIVLVESDPAPPAKGDDNRFILRVEDLEGNPVEATLSVRPFMPAHNHGSPTAPRVAAGDEAGTFEASSIDFIMGGLWRVGIEIDGPEGADRVDYFFCIDG